MTLDDPAVRPELLDLRTVKYKERRQRIKGDPGAVRFDAQEAAMTESQVWVALGLLAGNLIVTPVVLVAFFAAKIDALETKLGAKIGSFRDDVT